MKDLILNNKDLIISKLVEKNTVNSKGLIEMINVLSAERVVYADDIERLRKYFGGDKFRIVKNRLFYEVGLYLIESEQDVIDLKHISLSKKKVDNFELLNTQLVSELGSDYWVEVIEEPVVDDVVEAVVEAVSDVKEAVVEVKEEVKEPVNQKELIRLIKFKYKEISDLIQLLDDVKEPLSDIKEPVVEVKEEPIIEPISEPKPKEKEYFNIKLLHAGRPNRGQNRTKYIKRVTGINMHEKEAKRFEGEYLNAGENLLCNDDVIICTGWDGSSNQRRQYKVVEVYQVKDGELDYIDTFNYKSQFVSLTVKVNELLSYSVQTNAA